MEYFLIDRFNVYCMLLKYAKYRENYIFLTFIYQKYTVFCLSIFYIISSTKQLHIIVNLLIPVMETMLNNHFWDMNSAHPKLHKQEDYIQESDLFICWNHHFHIFGFPGLNFWRLSFSYWRCPVHHMPRSLLKGLSPLCMSVTPGCYH